MIFVFSDWIPVDEVITRYNVGFVVLGLIFFNIIYSLFHVFQTFLHQCWLHALKQFNVLDRKYQIMKNFEELRQGLKKYLPKKKRPVVARFSEPLEAPRVQ